MSLPERATLVRMECDCAYVVIAYLHKGGIMRNHAACQSTCRLVVRDMTTHVVTTGVLLGGLLRSALSQLQGLKNFDEQPELADDVFLLAYR